MKLYHPCPNCYGRRPIELSILENKPNIISILRCQDCGYIYRIGSDGRSIDFPKKKVYFKEILKLSHNKNLVNVFRVVEENKWINISGLSEKLKIDNSVVSEDVSELERNRVLDVRYLRGNRILTVGETKAADLFKELIREYL